MSADHPGVIDPMDKRNIRVNGDGFGIAWWVSIRCWMINKKATQKSVKYNNILTYFVSL